MNLSDDTTNNAKTVPRRSASDEHSNPKLECDTTPVETGRLQSVLKAGRRPRNPQGRGGRRNPKESSTGNRKAEKYMEET
jgi:hypothetical protein